MRLPGNNYVWGDNARQIVPFNSCFSEAKVPNGKILYPADNSVKQYFPRAVGRAMLTTAGCPTVVKIRDKSFLFSAGV